jgi:hypothetical protein
MYQSQAAETSQPEAEGPGEPAAGGGAGGAGDEDVVEADYEIVDEDK